MNSKNENEFPRAVAPSPPRWIDLPPDVTAYILQRLEVVDRLEIAENVCTTWRRICSDPAIWRVLHIKRTGFHHNEGIRNLWRRALDRSQGQLVDLSIEFSRITDNLLNYILDRSSGIKRLTLKFCNGFTVKGLVEAFNKLPHLEELRLMFLPQIEASDIVKIGISCPVLKSFTFGQYLYKNEARFIIYQHSNRNEYAVAIAKSMPNLCHLCLMTNLINNEGVEAILDGCPYLESLDLRQCSNLDLRGALGKRCSEQIKHLKFPCDDLSDYGTL